MIRLGPEQCRRTDEALTREWLVTNGAGGYASAAVTGTPTRRYHGLLVARLPPPAHRSVMLAQCEELVTYEGRAYQVSTTEYEDGTLAPAGYIHLAEFRLEHGLPVTVYEIGDTTLEKRVWMAHGRNTTYVQYQLAATARGPVELRLRPLVSGREDAQLQHGEPARRLPVEPVDEGCAIRFESLGATLRLRLTGGWYEPQPDWYWRVLYRRERERGLDYVEDLFAPGTLAATLRPGEAVTLVLSTEASERIEREPVVAWQLEQRRRKALLQRASLPADDEFGRTLVLAADTFLTAGASPRVSPEAPWSSVVTSYHWCAQAGRDVLISLPGLTLMTGRAAEGRLMLTRMLEQRRDGLLPAHFDEATRGLDYASADTTLWFFVALAAYLRHTHDETLLSEAWEALVEIVAMHEAGTQFGTQADPADGLLRAGETGYQLTWMDATAGDWVVTPRRGKPVEINALWYNALRQMAAWAEAREPARRKGYQHAADRVETSFNRRFWYAPGGYLYDVVDAETGDDVALRPNQILAMSLPFPVLARDRWRPVIDMVTDHLLTPFGLRTLSPGDPHYVGWYAGDPIHRDSAYHQGTVAPWLLGPFFDAYRRIYRNRTTVRDRLLAFEKHLLTAGLGTISEIYDGDAPHSPQGCIAHATAVGEVLRAWRAAHELEGDDEP